MRDLFFVGIMLFLFGLAFVRPYLATLCYIWVDLLQPQEQSYYLLNTAPISMIAAVVAVLAYLIADQEKKVRINSLQILLVVMIMWITITTSTAQMGDFAWFKWSSAWKALAFAAFLPLVLRTRLQIETALLVILFTICALMFSGAFKTLLGGGGYGHLSFLVQRNVGLFEASTLATVAIGMIPLALYLYKYSTLFPQSKWTRLITIGICASAILVVIGSEARTGFLCIAAIAFLEFRHIKRKFLVGSIAVVAGIASIPFLPDSFTGRMGTIKTYDEDTSASTRVAMWQWTWDRTNSHPMGGGFGIWRASEIVYEVKNRSGDGSNSAEGTKKIKDGARGFHSSYFEILGEQGWPGFAIFAAIFGGALWQLSTIARRVKGLPDMEWAAGCARALSHLIIVYLVGSIFTALAFQSTIYYAIAIAVSLLNVVAWHLEAQKKLTPVPVANTRRLSLRTNP